MAERKPPTQYRLTMRGLKQTVGDWPALAREADVPYHTLVKIANGTTASPTAHNVQRLFNALIKRGIITGHTPGEVVR